MNQLHHHFIDNHKPVLLLLHGFLGSMEQWNYLERYLSQHYSLFKIDLPGHGKSSESSHNYNLEELSLLIDNLLIEMKIDTVHILGHSMGGYLGAAFAKSRPEKISSLTLLNSITGEDTIERKALRDRSIKLIEKHQEAYVNMAIANLFTEQEHHLYQDRIDLMKTQARNISTNSIIQALKCMRDRHSLVENFQNINFPIHYIYGLLDQIIDPIRIETEQKLLKSKISKIKCGHMSLLTNVDDIVEKQFSTD